MFIKFYSSNTILNYNNIDLDCTNLVEHHTSMSRHQIWWLVALVFKKRTFFMCSLDDLKKKKIDTLILERPFEKVQKLDKKKLYLWHILTYMLAYRIWWWYTIECVLLLNIPIWYMNFFIIIIMKNYKTSVFYQFTNSSIRTSNRLKFSIKI
jgi:hypothetical protein